MRIAFVNDTFMEGRGADVVMYEIARRLGKKHEVYILAGQTDIKEENFRFIKINLPKLFTGKARDFNFFYNMASLRRNIKSLQKKHGFDLFVVFHSSLNVAFSGLPVIVVWLGSPETKNILRKTVNKAILRTLKNGKTIVISKYLREGIGFVKNVKVVYCGISEDFRPVKSKKQENYMLYVGRLERHKNVQEAIRLSKELDFPLKIAGYGTEEEKLKKMKERIGAPVEFLGKVSREKLITLYQNCSFFISPSRWEGFGLIFVEAGACGKPSIAYRTGSIPEVIMDKRTGFLVNNFIELKQRAKELIENKKLREAMGKNALSFSKVFDWEKGAEEYEQMFKRMQTRQLSETI